VALVGTDGTVDWYCPSRFDAPSLFGALLDARKGGYFSLWSRSSGRPKQLYLPDTNILLTRFQGAEAVGEVIDFMVPETSGTGRARDLLVRQAGWPTTGQAAWPATAACPDRSSGGASSPQRPTG
jgi:GH15 family glucan-1,4-alpha-glucosidase